METKVPAWVSIASGSGSGQGRGQPFSIWCWTERMARDTSGWDGIRFSQKDRLLYYIISGEAIDGSGSDGSAASGVSAINIICYGIEVFDISRSREFGFSEM